MSSNSNIYEVKVNLYRKKLREAIEKLNSVDRCFIYAGEFNSPEENNPSIQLQMNKSQVYIDLTFGQFVENPVVKGIDLVCNFRIFVAAKNDYNNPKSELRNESETCLQSIYEIIELLFENKFDQNVINLPEFQALEQLETGIRNKQRFSLYAFNFTQRINFYKKNK